MRKQEGFWAKVIEIRETNMYMVYSRQTHWSLIEGWWLKQSEKKTNYNIIERKGWDVIIRMVS